ncbi:ATP-dependent helicase HrpB [Paenibacillus dakarensis]|uniref:ATP-dependent helicase HrpB n=1 Tax=Paenibacillus dakarensis TaxID=1527293 RepID=UPI0006D540D6|nr:ATP-dependent helicase HrpB [Paenibacillus dakarensis]
MNKNELPIQGVLPLLKETFRKHNSAVLIAEPGAGKTTQTPIAFLDEPWLTGKKIIMLEPRRLAARAAATYMASMIGEPVGRTIGYRVRMESRTGRETVIEVVTEGILTRMLQSDPELSDVAMIIFDEFHERSIHADTGLALSLEAQSVLREDLKLLVMSATLDAEPVASLMGDAPIIHCTGRSFPVKTIYAKVGSLGLEQACSKVIQRALSEEDGDVLVFLPGVGEIRRTAQELGCADLPGNIIIRELYGQLSPEKQDEALRPAIEGQRRIILSTSIAETSLTIEGIRIVVDSGMMRTEVFSPRTGLPQLITKRVSRASADQRRGRAGRLAPGTCYRLWSEEEHAHLLKMSLPDIRQSDLTPLALELAVWGVRNPEQLSWLDMPPAAVFEQGRELLKQLGALDNSGAVTEHGRRMAELGMHPRLAHMLLSGKEVGHGALACRLAVLLQERDIFSGQEAAADRDITSRVEQILHLEQGLSHFHKSEGKKGTIKRMIQEIHHLCRLLGLSMDTKQVDVNSVGLVLSFAYPDRIAKNRGGGSFLLRSGRGAALKSTQPLSKAAYIVAAAVDDKGTDGTIQLASALDEEFIWRYYSNEITDVKEVVWDSSAGAVRARVKRTLGALVLKEQVYEQPLAEELSAAVLEGIRREGLSLLPWPKQAIQFRQRLQFMSLHNPGWPDVSDEALLDQLEDWLEPYLQGVRSRQALQKLHTGSLLENLLSWDQRQQLNQDAPTHIKAPGGSSIAIDYQDPSKPVMAVRLQEMFGLSETPRIAGGRVPLTIHLLSPAQRPVQVTSDLSSFWHSGYFEVKKDLKGRYPKHYWPDDPLQAMPTNRTKAKM